MKKHLGGLVSFFMFFIFIALGESVEVMAMDKIEVLFVSSHNPNHEAFNDQVEGIKDGLDNNAQLQIEYLDFKTFESYENEYNFYNLLKYKLNNYRKFDAIILGDDEAVRFGIKYRDELFKDIPIVFLAVNEVELADEATKKGFKGVIEKESIEDNLKLITTLHPNVKNIILVKDKGLGNTSDITEFYRLEPQYPNITFKHISIEEYTFDEFTTILSELDKDDVILTLYPHVDKTGKVLTHQEVVRLMDSATNVPIYGVSYYGFNNGIVGGKVINQYDLAKKSAEILKSTLYGSGETELYINDDSMNKYVFDYNKLKQYGIKESQLPHNSQILNKPVPFLEKYKELIIPIILIFIGLIGIIIALIIYSLNKTKHEKELLRAKELAEEASKAKGHFISNISHELRTPVTVIMSANQLLKLNIDKETVIRDNESNSSKQLIPNIETINQNCYRLLRLVNNIIDVAKVDSGFMELSLQNVNIVELIENISLSVISYAEMKNIEIIFDTTDEDVIMAVDPEKIEKIILNLLSNAIKFSKDSGVVKVELEFEDNKLRLLVMDNGVGISTDKIDKVFDKFVRVDESLTRRNEGSGIGLSIVKSFVELHNGSVEVESKVDVGTKFTIELPIRTIKNDKDTVGVNKSIVEEESTIVKTKVEFSDIYF